MLDRQNMTSTVGLSIEIELGWAKHDKGETNHLSDFRREETDVLERLLSHCERVNIPITFNVVGHLLLESCDGTHLNRPGAESWFEFDPGTNVETDPLFYAPDLIEKIRDSSVTHEICTHTFSHTPCNDTTPETVAWELAEARRVHESAGLDWSNTLVPPRHSPPDYEVALDHGIDTLRIPVPKRTFQMTKPERLYYSLIAPHPLKPPQRTSGMCLVYSSPYLSLAAPHLPHGQLDPHPIFQVIPRRIRKRWHRRQLRTALQRVTEREQTAHFWSHLWDISNSVQWPLVKSFLSELSEMRDDDKIEIVRLGDVRERVSI